MYFPRRNNISNLYPFLTISFKTYPELNFKSHSGPFYNMTNISETWKTEKKNLLDILVDR